MNEIIEATTVPIKKAVEPDLKAVQAAYVWKTGRTFFLSKKETIVADTFLKTRSYAECSRALKKEGFNKSWQTCMRWLQRSHLQEYLVEKFEESGAMAGMTEGRWTLMMQKHLQGKERLANGDLFAMKIWAQVKGYGQDGSGGINNNVMINFTERQG